MDLTCSSHLKVRTKPHEVKVRWHLHGTAGDINPRTYNSDEQDPDFGHEAFKGSEILLFFLHLAQVHKVPQSHFHSCHHYTSQSKVSSLMLIQGWALAVLIQHAPHLVAAEMVRWK